MPHAVIHSQAVLGKRKRADKSTHQKRRHESEGREATPEDRTGDETSNAASDASASGETKAPEPDTQTTSIDSDEHDSEEEEEDRQDIQDVFRRAFEKRFAPLRDDSQGGDDGKRSSRKSGESGRSDRERYEVEEDVWDGLDDDDDDESEYEVPNGDQGVDIVDYTSRAADEEGLDALNPMAKSEAKKFMSSKPPTLSSSTPATKTNTTRTNFKDTADDPDTTARDAANDLALQRLISESHLLSTSNSTFSHQALSNTTRTKTTRHAQNDIRLQRLGARIPIAQIQAGKMPMQHRVGILKKQAEKQARRRDDARKAGVILEKVRKERGREGGGKRRERGVGGPSVGKFRSGGTLVLGKDDIRGIVGGSAAGRGGGRRGGSSTKAKRRW